jgi:hypothetical protein
VKICNDSGPAMNAFRLQIDQEVFLGDRFRAIGAGKRGAVQFAGARIRGHLNCEGAKIHNKFGSALYAPSLQVDQNLFLHSFHAIGNSDDGAVQFAGAHIGGQLYCAGAKICNDSGPALDAYNLQVDQDLSLSNGFKAVGAGETGAVRLVGAHIGGQLYCAGAKMRNDSGPALNAYNLRVDQGLSLSDGFKAGGASSSSDVPGVVLDLTAARIGGTLKFDRAGLENRNDHGALVRLDGLTYSGLPAGISPEAWLRLLQKATPSYAAQPYQQLAAAHRASGHDREARAVLMAQRKDQIDRPLRTRRKDQIDQPLRNRRWERSWARFTGVTLGYGYEPWRALIGLLVIVAVAVTLAVTLGARGGLARVRSTAAPSASTAPPAAAPPPPAPPPPPLPPRRRPSRRPRAARPSSESGSAWI